MLNYVNKNQLGIALYTNTEQLTVKVVFVLASLCFLGHSKLFMVYFKLWVVQENIRTNSILSTQIAATVEILQNIPLGIPNSLFCEKHDDNYKCIIIIIIIVKTNIVSFSHILLSIY
jgi:hypothetical protein